MNCIAYIYIEQHNTSPCVSKCYRIITCILKIEYYLADFTSLGQSNSLNLWHIILRSSSWGHVAMRQNGMRVKFTEHWQTEIIYVLHQLEYLLFHKKDFCWEWFLARVSASKSYSSLETGRAGFFSIEKRILL